MVIPINISVVNQSTLFKDADLPALVNALQLQVSRDFYPIWGINANLFYTPTGKNPTPSHWALTLFDDADQAGALGYHDITPSMLPLGKAFVRTTQQAGDQISVTVSHELLEMLVDPEIATSVEVDDRTGAPSKFYAKEVADACEDDQFGYNIVVPAGWQGAGTNVLVSDFVTPAWFEQLNTEGPFDLRGKLKAPFELLTGGYIGMLDLGNLSQGWQQVLADADTSNPKAQMKARPHLGSRRQRRSLGKHNWVISTYIPGIETPVPAQKG